MKALVQTSFALLFLGLGAGCDAFMIVSQSAGILITKRVSGIAAEDAAVDFAYANRSPRARAKTDNEWLNAHAYRRRTTDSAGHASLLFDITWIAGGLLADRNTSRDRLTGEKYLFRIEDGTARELLTVEMTPNVTTQGRHFAITVLSIGQTHEQDAVWLSSFKHGVLKNDN